MGFSNIAAQQREKAAETLKSFLAVGLIGSVGLHIGLLAFGIGNFLDKVPPLKDESMELTLIEPPTLEEKPEIEKPVAETQEKSPPTRSNEIPKVVSAPSSIAIAPSVVTQKPSKPLTNIPKKQVVEKSKTPLPQQKPIQTPKEVTKPQPAPVAKITAPAKVNTAPEVVAASPTVPSSVAPRSPNNQKLRDLLATTRNTDQKPNNIPASSKPNALGLRQPSNTNNLPNQSGNGAVNSTNSGSRIVTGNTPSGTSTNITGGNSTDGINRTNSSTSGFRIGTNNRSGSNVATGNNPSNSTNSGSKISTNNRSGSNVATGAQNVRPRNTQPESNSNANASSGGLACRTCSKPKYPAKARRRGLEGKAEINVDVDGKGNVTKVRLARSSGHSELDKAALEEARRWKFKAPSGGKRSVSAKVDFAIEGSQRSRKLRERRKRRSVESRRAPIENARSNQATETPNTPTPTRSIRQRRQNSISSSPRRPQTATRRVDTLPPRKAEDAALPRRRARALRRSPKPAPITNQRALGQSLRRQRQSSSQTKLRQSLRQLKQFQPTANPND